jgi:hypothetical protein
MAEKPTNPLWEGACRAVGLRPDASLGAVVKAYGGKIPRSTFQRLRDTGNPRGGTLQAMADAIGVSAGKFLADPEAEGAQSRAHLVNPPRHDHPPLMTWEVIVSRGKELPERFRCEVPDDALWSPAEGGTQRGTPVVFVRTSQPPPPGTGVLVEDRGGERYVRIYRQAVGGWIAAARNANYLTLHSAEHGLTLLAVAENRLLDGQL